MRIVACLLVCCAAASAQGKGPRPDKNGGPKVGEDAPDFVLKTLDGESDVKLSTHEGEKPVVLLFASYTWAPFRSQAAALEKIYQKYKDRVAFYLVYIREAHSTTGRTSPANERAGIEIDEPKSAEEREDVAETCREELKLTIPILVDGMDNATEKKWAAWPDRGYIIGADGKVKFKSLQAGKFKAADVEKALVEHLKPLPETGQK